jgi:hypothetical protein
MDEREIHMVKMMRIIVYIRKTMNRSFGRPKNLLPFKVRNAIREGKSEHIICHTNH